MKYVCINILKIILLTIFVLNGISGLVLYAEKKFSPLSSNSSRSDSIKQTIDFSSGINSITKAKVNDIQDSAILKSDFNFKPGPVTELKWDNGPVSFGLLMDMGLTSLSGSSSQDLLVSRIWSGLFLYPMKHFDQKDLLESPLQVCKTGVLMFQAVDWDRDGQIDIIGADRDGFLYLIPATGKYPDIHYERSDENMLRNANDHLVFNIPFENPGLLRQNDLGGYTDVQYANYLFTRLYPRNKGNWKDLIIGDAAGNLWWLPDVTDGSGKPAYTGMKYRKEASKNKYGAEFQKKFGLDYVKPEQKICDEQGKPFLLGIGKEAGKVFTGSMARPFLYPEELGKQMGLIVMAGSNRQQLFYLSRINSLNKRKPVFKLLGEIKINGLDDNLLSCHSKLCLFRKGNRNDLLVSCGNYVATLENSGWNNGLPEFTFRGWISGPAARASGYVFTEMLTDDLGNRYILDFTNYFWKPVRVVQKPEGILLHYGADSLRILDQNGEFTVPGETDPQSSPEWGYHRMTRWDYDGSGHQHLVAATDKGNLYLLIDNPSLKKGNPFLFHSIGPLRDTSGGIIKIHNRAIAGSIDLNGDGREDLVVGGISYQLGIKSDPHPGGGLYYLLNLGADAAGIPQLTPAQPLEIGSDFRPRINSHISVQILDLNHDGEKEMILSLQDRGWNGRIYRKIPGKIGFYYTGFRLPMESIVEQILDIDGDSLYEIVRPGDESGVGSFRKLEKK